MAKLCSNMITMSSARHNKNLILYNANVLTLDPNRPRASLIEVKNQKITWVGSDSDRYLSQTSDAEMIDCGGGTVLPGFIDSHIHLMAVASNIASGFTKNPTFSSIDEITETVHKKVSSIRQGNWVRVGTYDHNDLFEKRHPSRWDLDQATTVHPVKLVHGSGHVSVLNSLALSLVNISRTTPNPEYGTIERQADSGEPTGVLFDMDSFLDERIPRISISDMETGLRKLNQLMLSRGITSVQDATSNNSPERWDFLSQAKKKGIIEPRITVMPGLKYMNEFSEIAKEAYFGDQEMDLGPVKIMLTVDSGWLTPDKTELKHAVERASELGFQVAIHAVEMKAVEAAAQLLGGQFRNRIEHCSECSTVALNNIARLGGVVVTQPNFIYERGDKYLDQVSDKIQPFLYRMKSLIDAGVTVAASSDAPISEPNPLLGIYSAVTRCTESGNVVGIGERVDLEQALAMHTINSAYAANQENQRGSIKIGKLADLVLIDKDLTKIEKPEILEAKVTLTVLGGRIAWKA
ncbi:MAG: amidohydrolase family protein [Chloroflexota bacterium]|nr:amidohydrolase family protein [Chloroflexota bacterium]